MIEVKNLQKKCGGASVASGVDFKLVNGAIYGVFDVRDPDRHAFLALLSGALLPDDGHVRINGFDTKKEPQRVSRSVGYVPKRLTPYPDLTPEEFLSLIAEARNLEFEEGMRQVNTQLDDAELRGKKRSLCTHLSAAESKRLCLAAALIGSPEILILDGIADGLDQRDADRILDRICALAPEKTVFLGSSDPTLLCDACDRILVLSSGKLIGIYTPDDELLLRYCQEASVAPDDANGVVDGNDDET